VKNSSSLISGCGNIKTITITAADHSKTVYVGVTIWKNIYLVFSAIYRILKLDKMDVITDT